MNIRKLDSDHYGYAMDSWGEGAKKSREGKKVPWPYFRTVDIPVFKKVFNDSSTVLLGAYTEARDALVGPGLVGEGKLVGWLAMTPGKRVHTVHWVHTKYELDGKLMRRRGVMTALLDAADLGARFIYTVHGQHDAEIVTALRTHGVTATFVPLKEWLK